MIENPNKKRLRRSMMFLNAQKPSLIKDPYIYKIDSLMLDLEDAVEYQLSELDLTGNLFEDVLNVGELLAGAEIYAEDFISAYSAIARYEDMFRSSYLSRTDTADLPF
jgi:hypothetical protein